MTVGVIDKVAMIVDEADLDGLIELLAVFDGVFD